MGPEEIIPLLGLEPHPEGGYYRETWRESGASGGEGASGAEADGEAGGACGEGSGTAIYFLLRSGDRSHWHRIDRPEMWHVYAGGALELSTWSEGAAVIKRVLGPDLLSGQRPQALVGAGIWQSARPLSPAPWVLAGCTVCPAFEFRGFELAPPDWEP